VSVDLDVEFLPAFQEGAGESYGILQVPASARFVINDGQHRRAAIAQALKENKSLAEETIPLVIFVDSDLKRSQQMFADLNRYSVRPTKSLSVLYDRRDPLSAATLEVISRVRLFRGAVEFGKTSLSNRSPKLFTLSNVYEAMARLLSKSKGDPVSSAEKNAAVDFWRVLSMVIPEWQDFISGRVRSSTLRKDYVHAHGVILVALGIAGSSLLRETHEHWREHMASLGTVDWRRSNTNLWEGIAMEGGKISKAHRNVRLTSILLKETMSLDVDPKERELLHGKTST
jgi:DNA sulfur modification protein DndB